MTDISAETGEPHFQDDADDVVIESIVVDMPRTRHRSGHSHEPAINMDQPRLTRRQQAEVQLAGIINNPELSLPIYCDDETVFKVSELATRLQAQPWFVRRLVAALGFENVEILKMREVHMITRVLTGSFDARVLLFFKMIDTDGDRYVQRAELYQFFKDYTDSLYTLHTFEQTNNEENRETILNAILRKFQLHESLYIEYDVFYDLMAHDEVLIEILSHFTVHPNWFADDSDQQKKDGANGAISKVQAPWIKRMILKVLRSQLNLSQRLYNGVEERLSRDYFYSNFSRFLFFFIYLAVSLGLFIWVIVYRVRTHLPWLEVIARICGMQLNFNCALMIVLMLRNTARLIRTSRRLHALIPVDDSVTIHARIGRWIVVLASIHGLCHMIYFGVEGHGYSWGEIMFTARGHVGRLNIAPLTGVILSIVFAIMVICSMQFVRRGGHFELFYWSHLLYIVFYVLLVIHTPYFWCWFVGPAAIFVVERVYNVCKQHSSSKGRAYLHSATIEEANVIKLTISRPSQFHFQPGDYVFLNIPTVARYEWHPFTLSSAPEDKKLLTVHIQSVGNWTGKVFKRYKELCDGTSALSKQLELEGNRERVRIDGPYASCARYIFNTSHAILIGAGIGATPYSSVLSSCLAQYRAVDKSQPLAGVQTRLTKVDFIWINRSVRNVEWFLKLLATIEQEQDLVESLANNETTRQNSRFLDVHLYFTEIKKEDSIGFVPLNLVARVYEQAYHRDVFTQLKTKTHVGRPNWGSLFDKILARYGSNKPDVDVFFCGPKTMAEAIEVECLRHAITFHQEEF